MVQLRKVYHLFSFRFGAKQATCRFISLRPSDACMCQQTKHHCFRQWLLAWLVPYHCQSQCWNSGNWTLRTNLSEILHSMKCIWKCRRENGGHFVSASMYYWTMLQSTDAYINHRVPLSWHDLHIIEISPYPATQDVMQKRHSSDFVVIKPFWYYAIALRDYKNHAVGNTFPDIWVSVLLGNYTRTSVIWNDK